MPFNLKGAEKSPIYPSVAKRTEGIEYLLFDEVNSRIRSLRRLGHEFFMQTSYKSYPICLYRNPFVQFVSMQSKGKRFSHPGFNARSSDVKLFIADWLANYSFTKRGIAVAMEDLVSSPSECLKKIYGALSINDPEFADIDSYLTSAGCKCGGDYEQGETDEILGYFFRVNNIRLPHPEKAWICTSCSRPALGYGGFNPYKRNGDSSRLKPIANDVHKSISDRLSRDIDDDLISFFSKDLIIEP